MEFQLSIGVAVLCLPWLRWKQPQLERPIRVNLFWPILYLLCTIFVTAVPMAASPYETGMGVLMILSSVPVYYVFVYWPKPRWFQQGSASVTTFLQKIFVVVGKSKTAKVWATETYLIYFRNMCVIVKILRHQRNRSIYFRFYWFFETDQPTRLHQLVVTWVCNFAFLNLYISSSNLQNTQWVFRGFSYLMWVGWSVYLLLLHIPTLQYEVILLFTK